MTATFSIKNMGKTQDATEGYQLNDPLKTHVSAMGCLHPRIIYNPDHFMMTQFPPDIMAGVNDLYRGNALGNTI